MPNEKRWTAPVKHHISCAPDPGSEAPNNSTLAVSYAISDIASVYENFVIQIVSELLVDGPSAPFYKSLIESGLGTSFAPCSGEKNLGYSCLFILYLKVRLFGSRKLIFS